ncbi:MAG: hypothetical protein SGILL_005847 [Bacillariaceae sp.]
MQLEETMTTTTTIADTTVTAAGDELGSLDRLVEILEHPERRILPLLTKTEHGNDKSDALDARKTTLQELVNISKSLFRDIETLGGQYQQLSAKKKTHTDDNDDEIVRGALSGLPELFVSPDMPAHDNDLPETIFGQLDLQNSALLKLARKSTKRLGKADKICVLDMSLMEDGEGDSDDSGSEDGSSKGESDNEELDDDQDEEDDDEAMRMRERMERAMEDMEDEGDDEESVDQAPGVATRKEKKEEEVHDPIAEDMKDGFFDLNEMEGFADEEEDYLPEEAFGQPDESRTKKKPAKSFHQRQRDGEMDDGDSDDEGDDFDDLYEDVKEVKRKQYREQEDIDALYSLYQNQGSDDRGAIDAANMTAADLFGAPRKDYIARYKKNHPPSKVELGDDDDSWGDYDFEKADQAGWGDDEIEGDKEGMDDSDDDQEQRHEERHGGPISKSNGSIKKPTKHEEKLRQQTEELEKEMLAEKPWQMTGESKGTSRPVNSLLDATPEFEMASKQAPIITVEHTMNLEDVIKKRVLAEDWDDVVPRELPDIGWDRKRGEAPEVSQEKSKLGLGELYEREYLKKAVGYDKDAAEKQTEEDRAKDEMKRLFANLCSKLDALSNYHFAPRPVADEAEVRPVTAPAVAMEEVLPLHVSDARGVAPEEVYATKRGREGLLRADSEMDQGDRKRMRQSKKVARRKARKEKQADEKLISRLQPGLGLDNPYEKRKARQELEMARSRGKVVTGEQDLDAKFGASGTFFKRLQAEAQQSIQASAGEGEHSEKRAKAKSSAYKL